MTKLLVSGSAESLLALFATLNNRADIVAEIVPDSRPTTPPVATTRKEVDVPRRDAMPSARVLYVPTALGMRKAPTGSNAARVLEALRKQPMGLGQLQWHFRKPGNFMEPKTVDGSVTILKNGRYIAVRQNRER